MGARQKAIEGEASPRTKAWDFNTLAHLPSLHNASYRTRRLEMRGVGPGCHGILSPMTERSRNQAFEARLRGPGQPRFGFPARVRFSSLIAGACIAILASIGCVTPAAPLAGPDAAPIPATPDAGADAPDAAPAPPGLDAGPAPLSFRARAITDAGVVDLAADAATEIPVDSRFELELGAVKDVRVRLFDESDKAVPSTDKLELGQSTRYFLAPDELLVPGSGYALVIDGLHAWEPTDAAGKSLQMTRIPLRTAGEKPSPPPSSKASAKAKKKPKKSK